MNIATELGKSFTEDVDEAAVQTGRMVSHAIRGVEGVLAGVPGKYYGSLEFHPDAEKAPNRIIDKHYVPEVTETAAPAAATTEAAATV